MTAVLLVVCICCHRSVKRNVRVDGVMIFWCGSEHVDGEWRRVRNSLSGLTSWEMAQDLFGSSPIKGTYWGRLYLPPLVSWDEEQIQCCQEAQLSEKCRTLSLNRFITLMTCRGESESVDECSSCTDVFALSSLGTGGCTVVLVCLAVIAPSWVN